MLQEMTDKEFEVSELSMVVLEQTYKMLNASWLFRFAWRHAMRKAGRHRDT